MGRLLVIPLALLGLLAGAMVWSGGGGEEPADLAFSEGGDIRTLDPNRMSWAEDIRIGYALFEGLYTLHPETLEPIAGTAGRIEISPDKRVYTFHIRPEARWTNGLEVDEVLAADFVFSWKRMLDTPADYTYLFDYIQGARDYRAAVAQGRPADFSSVGIEAIGPRTLRVTLQHPTAFFPELCAFAPFFPLHEKSMARFRETDPRTGRAAYRKEFMRPPNLMSNGPYRLASWEFKKRIRLIASEHYWDRANVRSRIVDRVIVEDNMLGEYLRYQTGSVHWLADVDNTVAAELIARGRRDPAKSRADLHIFPAFGTYFYTLNCQPKLERGRDNPLSDVRVRKALAMSIDKRPIVETITRLGEPVAQHYVPPGSLRGYESPAGHVYDVEAARKLLAEAGYPGGRGFPPIRLTYSTTASHAEIAQAVRRQWLNALGISVDLEPLEAAIFSQRLRNKEYAIARASWFGDYADISTFLDKYLSTSANNDSGWSNPEYDRLCREAAREADPAKRLAICREAERILLDEVPIIPVFYYVHKFAFGPDVKGVAMQARDRAMLKAIWVEP